MHAGLPVLQPLSQAQALAFGALGQQLQIGGATLSVTDAVMQAYKAVDHLSDDEKDAQMLQAIQHIQQARQQAQARAQPPLQLPSQARLPLQQPLRMPQGNNNHLMLYSRESVGARVCLKSLAGRAHGPHRRLIHLL